MFVPCKVCSLSSPAPDPVPASKYKCPKCLTPYCSVACFKSHECRKILISNPDHELSQNQLSLIFKLNSPLSSPDLLKILGEIDASPTSNDAVDNLKKKRMDCKDLDDWCKSILKTTNAIRSGSVLQESFSSDESSDESQKEQDLQQDQGLSNSLYIVH